MASEFHFKASQKGVRLVYINLVIGNASYDPLELQDVFLPPSPSGRKNVVRKCDK